MAIVIKLINDPEKKKGESGVVLTLTRDTELGFRLKAIVAPTKREILRIVSDCPLAITEDALLWLQRHNWEWKKHPKSLDLQELLRTVKQYTPLLPPQHIEKTTSFLMKNFSPARVRKNKNISQQDELEHLESHLGQMAEPVKAKKSKKVKKFKRPKKKEENQDVDYEVVDIGLTKNQESDEPEEKLTPAEVDVKIESMRDRRAEEKLRKTHEQYQQIQERIALVEKAKLQKHYQNPDNVDDLLAGTDGLLEEDSEESETSSEEIEMEVPEYFESPEAAWEWGMEAGAFDTQEEAKEVYDSIRKKANPQNAVEMAKHWANMIEIMVSDGAIQGEI